MSRRHRMGPRSSGVLAWLLAGLVALPSVTAGQPIAFAQNQSGHSAAGQPAADSGMPTALAPAARPFTAFALQPLNELSQTRERPLFSPGRRPPPAAAPLPSPPPPRAAVAASPPPVAAPQAATFVLTGIALGPDARVAILRNVATNAINRVQRGETVEGWAVVDIEARAVVLRNGSASTRLELFPTPEARR